MESDAKRRGGTGRTNSLNAESARRPPSAFPRQRGKRRKALRPCDAEDAAEAEKAPGGDGEPEFVLGDEIDGAVVPKHGKNAERQTEKKPKETEGT